MSQIELLDPTGLEQQLRKCLQSVHDVVGTRTSCGYNNGWYRISHHLTAIADAALGTDETSP